MASTPIDPLLNKQIHATVVNDHVLSGEVAAQVCASLGLASTNATLGRKVVSLALTAAESSTDNGNGLAVFIEEASQYGTLSASILQGIYHKVRLDYISSSHCYNVFLSYYYYFLISLYF